MVYYQIRTTDKKIARHSSMMYNLAILDLKKKY